MWSSFQKAHNSARRISLHGTALCQAIIQILLALVLPAAGFIGTLAAAPSGKAHSVYETERTLVLLPVEGAAKGRYAYLKKGAMRILAGRLRSFGFMYIRRARLRFYFRTGDERSKGDKRSNGKGGPARVDFRVRMLEANEENYKVLKLYDAPVLARRFNAQYLLRGRLLVGEGGPRLLLKLYDAQTNRSREFSFELNPDRPYVGMTAAAGRIFSAVSAVAPVTVSVETTKPGAMAYLDSVYLGRTPLEYRIVPGSYRLRLEQDGYAVYAQPVRVSSSGARFSISNRPVQALAGLSVKSKPPGARVFLNDRYLGKTPLERKDLPAGTHRLRVVREKYIDQFQGVVLRNNKHRRVSVSLSPGDTTKFYNDPGHVVLDWTYYDLSLYSWISALGFYANFAFLRVRADRTAASIRAEVPLFLGINELGTLATGLDSFVSSLTAYQLWKGEQNLAQVHKFRRRADVSGGLGVLAFLAGGLFLYLGLRSDDRDVGEIGYFLDPVPVLFAGARDRGFSSSSLPKEGTVFLPEAGISGGISIRF